jgi:hypothetical protein
MILPSSRKYDESRKQPYVAILDRLGRCLNMTEDATLIAAGFGFGDDHINDVLVSALNQSPRAHVIALMFDDPEPESPITRLALRHPNLLVLARRSAIVNSTVGTWRAPGPGAANMFLSNGVYSDSDGLSIGDFNVLCDLFTRISGRR